MKKFVFLILTISACNEGIELYPIMDYQYHDAINFSEERFLGYYDGNSYTMYFDTNEYPKPHEAHNSAIERKLNYGLEFLGDKTGYKHFPDTAISFTWNIDTRTRSETVYRIYNEYILTDLIINSPESPNPIVFSLDLLYDTLRNTDYKILNFEWWTKDYINPYYDSVNQEFEGFYIQAISEYFEKK